MAKRRKKDYSSLILIVLLVCFIVLVAIAYEQDKKKVEVNETERVTRTTTTQRYIDLDSIPDYEGNEIIELNNNIPDFKDEEYVTESYEYYSNLDSLGRCGETKANIGIDLMPTEERKSISDVKPSGWVSTSYDIVPGKSLYNRCHLIGYQLTGENANKNNLITCTRTMNTVSMLYYENLVTNYIKTTNNHVLYRVTPIYDGDNLVAKGVIMEGSSVEDKCGTICYNVFIYNVQKGIVIDYKTGQSRLESE